MEREGMSEQQLGRTLIPFPGEQILLRCKKHWGVFLFPIITLFLLYFLSAVLSFIVLVNFLSNVTLFALTSLVLLAFTTSFALKLLVDWHYHFYILTTHRILEVCQEPLFLDHINNVILSQVKSTEIDVDAKGIVSILLDMGDVTVTFDRPTHQEVFLLSNIKNPKAVGMMLADALDAGRPDTMRSPIWFRSKDSKHQFKITEDIFPTRSLGIS